MTLCRLGRILRLPKEDGNNRRSFPRITRTRHQVMTQISFEQIAGSASEEAHSSSKYADESIRMDLQEEGLIMDRARTESGRRQVRTNVPHLVENHSPGGYEFGYGGSGPADLALNATMVVLNRVANEENAELTGEVEMEKGVVSRPVFNSYQEFKDRFVAPAPREGAKVPWEELREWAVGVLREEDAASL